MKEIIILDQAPVIFSKDLQHDWNKIKLVPGAIIILPEDAVLYTPPNN